MTTPPPLPAGQPATNPLAPKKSGNTLLYALVGVLAIGGGGYYYYTQEPEKVDHLKAKEEKLKQKSLETHDSAKSKTNSVLRKGEAKYDDVKVCRIRASCSARRR